MEADRDQNAKTILLGYDEISGEPLEVAIDPITGYILAEIIPVTADTPPTTPLVLPRDENGVTVMGAYNEISGEVEPIYIDVDNGGIRADVDVQ